MTEKLIIIQLSDQFKLGKQLFPQWQISARLVHNDWWNWDQCNIDFMEWNEACSHVWDVWKTSRLKRPEKVEKWTCCWRIKRIFTNCYFPFWKYGTINFVNESIKYTSKSWKRWFVWSQHQRIWHSFYLQKNGYPQNKIARAPGYIGQKTMADPTPLGYDGYVAFWRL